MSSITKEQWKKLEEEMTSEWVSIRMKYNDYDLYITRVRLSESKTALAVYIDDVIKPIWGLLTEEVEDRPSIIRDVWHRRTKAKYTAKQVKSIEKIYGKRRAKKEYPELHERWEFFDSYFPKASVLCRQFKKLEGLELIDGGGYVHSA